MAVSMKHAAVAGIAVAVLAGCSTTSTESDQVALLYKGGFIQSREFKECVPAAKYDFSGPGDTYYTYPAGQRNWRFNNGEGDAEPITFTTKDGVEMSVEGVLNFSLNTDCETLQQFHEKIGNRYGAHAGADGWRSVLGTYIAVPLDTAVDRVAQTYTYEQLYLDPVAKAEWERAVGESLPALVGQQTEGDAEYFQGFQVTLGKPEPPTEVKSALVARQTAVADAQTARAKADAQVAAAEAQIAVERAEAAKAAERIAVLGVDGYLQEQALKEGINPWQPTGSGVLVGEGR